MMEFLYRLYSYDYFGIGLFIVITILAFSFLIILFFGKKDEKTRNENEVKENSVVSDTKENIEEENKIVDNSLETVSLPVDEKQPENSVASSSVEPELNPFSLNNVVLNSNLVETSASNETIELEEEEEKKETEENEYNLDAVADELNTELNNEVITDEKNEEEFDPFKFNEPVIKEEVKKDIFSEKENIEPVSLNTEAPKKVVMPAQFSSVYLSRDNEPIKPEEEKKPVEVVEEEINPIPLKPEFELPKPLDLPKLNKNAEVEPMKNENIINQGLGKENNNLNNIFDTIEEDTYTIEK
jgi:hypothetical protein